MKKNYKRFKIFPVRGDKDFYMVYIFNDRTSMRMASMQLFDCKESLKAQAITHSYKAHEMKDGKLVPSHNVGSIMLYEKGFGAGVVAHEIAHAVNYYFLRKKLTFNVAGKVDKNWKDKDEIYAWILGYMVNQFWKKYYRKPKRERY